MTGDAINHPKHYTQGAIETWDFIVDKGLDFLAGNVVKYIVRAGKKDGVPAIDDLRKAQAYINKMISIHEAQ